MKNYIFEIFNFNNLISLRTGIVSVFTGGIGSLLGWAFSGEVKPLIVGTLALTILLDWLGAFGAARKDGSYASQYGIIGIIRTAVILLLPIWGANIDKILGTGVFFYSMLTGGLIMHTAISMTANFKRAGWNVWIPMFALEWVTSEIEAKMKRAQERTSQKEE